MRWGAALLVVLLAVPFDASWPDFEVARRGLLLLCAGALAAFGPLWCRRPWPRGASLLAALCAWYLVRVIGATNPDEGLLRAAHLAALAVLFYWGAGHRPRDLAPCVLPAVVLVSIYGLLQAGGLDWPQGYARATEPVSTLGNRNVASELAALGAAAAVATWARSRRPVLPEATLLLTSAYIGVNGSRAGIVAIVAVLAFAMWDRTRDRTRRHAFVLIAIAAAGIGAASLILDRVPSVTRFAPTTSEAGSTERAAAPSTIAIRLEMWGSCMSMIGDAPLFGHGSGQFRYEYPRFRTQDEIELSSFGRQFATFAATPHDDPLEIAVETGLVGLGLWLAFLVRVLGPRLRSRDGWCEVAPAIAFVVLSLVRSPLGNAPAAAVAFAYLGALARDEHAPRGHAVAGARAWAQSAAVAIGLPFLGLGVVLAQMYAADCLRSIAAGSPSVAPAERAVAWHPSESRHRSLLIGVRRITLGSAGAYRASLGDLAVLARIDPNNTTALLLTAELAHAAGDSETAGDALARLLALDPREPQAVLLAAVMACEAGDVPRAIAILYADPHPTLRRGLAAHLDALSSSPKLEINASGLQLLMRETAFVRALDAVLADPASEAAGRAIDPAARRLADDPRVDVLRARRLQALGDDRAAAVLAPAAAELSGAARRLLAEVLAELRALAEWGRALDGS